MQIQSQESKTEQASAALLGLIGDRGPGIKLPTIQEMCGQFKLSRTPLENAIRTLEARGLLRRRRGSGIYVTNQARQKTIGVIFGGDIFSPNFSPFWNLLLQAVREQADEREICPRAYLDISHGREKLGGHMQLIEDLEAHRLDGLLLLSPDHTYDEVGELRATGIPLVVFGGGDKDWSVTHDHDRMIRLAARQLSRQKCRCVAFMGHPAQRLLFESELLQHGMPEAQLVDWSYETWATIIPGAGTRENCAFQLTRRMIANRDQEPLPDSLLSMEDTGTRGVITALHQAGLQPGRDMRIVTMANLGSPVLTPYAADLFQIIFDPAEAVSAALTLLKTLMEGGTPLSHTVLVGPRG